jgi:hypothetical protein
MYPSLVKMQVCASRKISQAGVKLIGINFIVGRFNQISAPHLADG